MTDPLFSDPSLYYPSTVALGVQQVVFLLASNYELWMITLFVQSENMSIPLHSSFPHGVLYYILPRPRSYLCIAYPIRLFNA